MTASMIVFGTSENPPELALAPVGKRRRLPGQHADMSMLRTEVALALRRGVDLAVELKAGGWTAQHNQGLASRLVQFDDARLACLMARDASKQATRDFHALHQDTLTFRDQLVSALRIATQGVKNPVAEVRLHLAVSRPPARLAQWLSDVLPLVAEHEPAVRASLGADPIALTNEHGARLLDGMARIHLGRALLPNATRTQEAARLKLVAAIHEQRLSAAIAFPRNRAMRRRFTPVWEEVRNAKRRKAARAALPAPTEAPRALLEAAAIASDGNNTQR